MSFDGAKIRLKAKEAGLSLTALADRLQVSRQAVNTWIDGRVPRGKHLVELCSILGLKPGDFFEPNAKAAISAPLHRTIMKKKVTPGMTEASTEMAGEYLNIFRQAPDFAMVPVARVQERNTGSARKLAEYLRKMSKANDDRPMDYAGAFKLLDALNVYVVLRPFPQEIVKQSYAFYSRIADQRVVFVNIDTNVLDLIYFLLHETVHAIRDEDALAINTEAEETFCDKVAMFTQFPDYYVANVATAIKGGEPSHIVNLLKNYSATNGHSVYGLYYRLKEDGLFPDGLSVGGAAANLNKRFPSLRDVLYKDPDPRYFVSMLGELSPHFMRLVKANLPDATVRKVGEWLGLDTTIDTKTVIEEMDAQMRKM
jgi:DNA-binding Xre family transcriptional regulator